MRLNHFEQSYNRQQGYLLPVALVIILMAAGAAIMMTKQLAQISTSFLVNRFSLQTTYAVETGVQLGRHQVFFPVANRQQTDNRCQLMSINQTFNISGLDQCRIRVSCTCLYENNNACNTSDINNYNGAAGINHSFYRVESRAQCGTDFFIGRDNLTKTLKYP